MLNKKSFRNSAAFGKRMEYWIIGRMLKEGLDVYVPLVDDHAVDAIIKREDGSTALIQIKARSNAVIAGDAALFAAIPHEEVRLNYWFVFYSERMDTLWIMTSEEFDREAVKNKTAAVAMPRRQRPSRVWGYAPGAQPHSLRTTLKEGHSRFRTSGGKAVAMIPQFLKNVL